MREQIYRGCRFFATACLAVAAVGCGPKTSLSIADSVGERPGGPAVADANSLRPTFLASLKVTLAPLPWDAGTTTLGANRLIVRLAPAPELVTEESLRAAGKPRPDSSLRDLRQAQIPEAPGPVIGDDGLPNALVWAPVLWGPPAVVGEENCQKPGSDGKRVCEVTLSNVDLRQVGPRGLLIGTSASTAGGEGADWAELATAVDIAALDAGSARVVAYVASSGGIDKLAAWSGFPRQALATQGASIGIIEDAKGRTIPDAYLSPNGVVFYGADLPDTGANDGIPLPVTGSADIAQVAWASADFSGKVTPAPGLSIPAMVAMPAGDLVAGVAFDDMWSYQLPASQDYGHVPVTFAPGLIVVNVYSF